MDFESLKKEIETLAQPVISTHGLHLNAINLVSDFGGPGIEILVTHATKPETALDFETLSRLNEALATLLDQHLKLSDHYYLIVGSGGLEREITSEAELIQSLEKYLALDLQQPVKEIKHFEGYLKNYNPDTKIFRLEFFKKGQKQKVEFTWAQIDKVRHAVKF